MPGERERGAPTPGLHCLACGATDAEPWAHGRDVEYLTTSERFTLYRCRRCGVLFIDPVPSDRLGQIYPPNYYSFAAPQSSFVHRVKEWLDGRMLRRLLRELPGAELSVLDVGGGAGWQLGAVRRLDPRVSFTQVVDFDPAAAEVARASGHEYFCGRIEEYETARKFDMILLLNLIEHVADPAAVLRKVSSMLAPRGVALVKTPNYDSLDARIFRHRDWGGYHCPRHWVLFTRESFQRIAAGAGLRVKRFAYTQGAPFWAVSVLSRFAARDYVSITKERPVMSHPLFPVLSAAFAAFDLARAPFAKLSQMFFVLTRDDGG